MITKEMIKNEIDRLPDESLEMVYQYILDAESHIIPKSKKEESSRVSSVVSSKGIFTKYNNPDLIQSEKKAWTEAVREKHADYRR